jgi:class 3 adenylate cyclase/predicted ATPase
MRCVNCQTALNPGAKFCPECGTPQPRACPACQAPVASGARFCQECGTALGAVRPTAASGPEGAGSDRSEPPAGPRPGMGAASSSGANTSLSPEGMVAAVAAGAGERRQMSVIFCDLVNSVGISRQLDPEDLRDLIRDYRQVCSDIVRRYDGTPAQFQGDGIVVYFGYPVAHEDAPRRAVQAALEIVQAVQAMAPQVQRRLRIPLAVRAAVHTGLAVIGEFGADASADAMGSTVNIAARIQSAVGPDQVALSAATQRLVAGFFEVESLGEQQLKGVAEPMPVFLVHRATRAHDRVEAASAMLTPYVGHVQTIETLQDLWRAAASGHGRAVFLTGEPGVGKSRMLAEFRRAMGHEGEIIECWCSPHYSHTALNPIVRTLRRRMLGEETMPVEAQHALLQSQLKELGCRDEMAWPIVAEFFGMPMPPGYEPLHLHPLTHRQKTIATFGTMLMARATVRPTLLLVEDLHWSDATTVELLGSLLMQLRGLHMLVVVTSRPGFAPPWISNEGLMSVHVNQLSRSETEALIAQLSEGRPLPPHLVSVLVDKTEGNPLYVEEMTRMFLDAGAAQTGSGGAGLAAALPESLVPASLNDLLMARLDRLSQQARRVVQLGSVVGREWSFELLLELLPGEEDALARGIEELVAAGFIYATERGFRIKHALIQDAAYDSLLKRVRQQYHRRVAEALSRRGGDAGHDERLAQHWTRAGEPAKAAPLWLEVGRRAVAASATVEAESHLRAGLAALADLPESAERDMLELATLATLGVALTIRNGWAAPDVVQAYQQAEAVSRRLGPTPQLFWVLWGMWAYYLVKGDQHEGMAFARRLMALAVEQQDRAMKLEADFALGLSHYYMGELDAAQQHLDAAIDVYEPELHHANAQLTAQDVGVTSRSVAAMVLYLRGHTQDALEMSREALRLSERLRHPFSRAYALGCAAWFHHLRGDMALMAEHARQTIDHASAQALGFWVVWGMIFAGRAAAEQGPVADALAQSDQGLATMAAIGSGMVVPYFKVMLAEVEAGAGDPVRALQRLVEAREQMAAGGEVMAAPEVERAEVAIREGWAETQPGNSRAQAAPGTQGTPGPLDATERLQQALHNAQRQGNRLFALRAAVDLAALQTRRGEAEPALALLQQAIHAMPDTTPTPDLERARGLAEVLTLQVGPAT